MDFFNKIPVMDRTALRELKKGIDFSFKEFLNIFASPPVNIILYFFLVCLIME